VGQLASSAKVVRPVESLSKDCILFLMISGPLFLGYLIRRRLYGLQAVDCHLHRMKDEGHIRTLVLSIVHHRYETRQSCYGARETNVTNSPSTGFTLTSKTDDDKTRNNKRRRSTHPSTMSEEVKKLITLDEVKQHTTAESCWLVIGNASNGTCMRKVEDSVAKNRTADDGAAVANANACIRGVPSVSNPSSSSRLRSRINRRTESVRCHEVP
jgi:hypothetical protein